MNTKEYDSIGLKITAYELALKTFSQEGSGSEINFNAAIASELTVKDFLDAIKKSPIGLIEPERTVRSEAQKIYEWLIAD